jgi:hypothetical protein
MGPPAAAERLLDIERRLRAKLTVAGTAIGTDGAMGPWLAMLTASDPHSPTVGPSTAELMQSTREIAQSWLGAPSGRSTSDLVAAAVKTADPVSGFLGLVETGGRAHIVASVGGPASADLTAVSRATQVVTAPATDAPASEVASALRELQVWARRQAISSSIGLENASGGTARRAALERVAECVARSPRHRRPTIGSLAACAREMLVGRLSAGTERCLVDLSRVALDDETWLQSVCALRVSERGGPGTPADPGLSLSGSSASLGHPVQGVRVVILIRSTSAP